MWDFMLDAWISAWNILGYILVILLGLVAIADPGLAIILLFFAGLIWLVVVLLPIAVPFALVGAVIFAYQNRARIKEFLSCRGP